MAQANEKTIKELRIRRGQLRAQITRFADFVERIPDARDPKAKEIPFRRDRIQQAFAELENIQTDIDILEGEEPDEHSAERILTDDKYYAALAKAEGLREAVEPPSPHSPQFASVLSDPESAASPRGFRGFPATSPANVKLPQISIPQFAGSYDKWCHFADTFKLLVHENETLNDVQRFHYLISALSGEAAQVIASLQVSSANYSIAWELLRTRFENKKAIIRNHVKNLFELPNVAKESHTSLRQFLDNFLKDFRALRNLNEPVDTWGTLLIYLLVSKLDASSKREWETLTYNQTSPDIETFITFLTRRCQLLEALDTKGSQITNHNTSKRFIDSKAQAHVAVTNNNNKHSKTKIDWKCLLCGSQEHMLFRCKEFSKLPVPARIREVRRLKACINCLRIGHESRDCYFGACRSCGKKHNTLLHLTSQGEGQGNTNRASTPEHGLDSPVTSRYAQQQQTPSAVTTHAMNSPFVLLSTARILLSNERGSSINCRALLDNGSQSCFVTSEACERLNLNVNKTRVPVTGINGVTTNIRGRARATVRSTTDQFQSQLEFLVLDRITEKIPQMRCDIESLCLPYDINLADPHFNEPGTIDVLLGASIFFELLTAGQFKLAREGPVVQNSKLGWIISGPLGIPNITTQACHVAQNNIADEIEKFWRIEEPEGQSSGLSREEAEVEEHFSKTHTRSADGRFVLRLPTRENINELGSNLYTATRRFHALERKLQSDPERRMAYTEFMKEYITLGHMSPIKADHETDHRIRYYLPHHAVTKVTSVTTKVRVVFNASCKSETGLSLNDSLKTGPCIQPDIFAALLRFRVNNVAFTSDIAKMYRQFLVYEQDRSLQRILWRSDPLEPLEHFQLNTITYGTAPASFLATRCLKQLAIENRARYPDASAAIENEFYMDDWIGGAPNRQSAIELIHKVTSILKSAGLELRQWVANDGIVLEGAASVAAKLEYTIKTDQSSSKTLGVNWNASSDTLNFCTTPTTGGEKTKREILSAIAQIFDPLGLIGPVVLTAKLLMQELWKGKTGWDEPVAAAVQNKWKRFATELCALNQVVVPRQMTAKNFKHIELHGMCDASQAAYGACVYVKSQNLITGEISTRLMCSKSRVAPLRVVTLPRLELCGAVLLARLMQRITSKLNISINKIVLWCDSTIVLAWIAADPSRFKIFVANRVSLIQKITQGVQWRYVPGRMNAADHISRGCFPHEIRQLDVWWHGPDFLAQGPELWPLHPSANEQALPELKRTTLLVTSVAEEIELVSRFSSFSRLTRVCAYVRRFARNCRSSVNRRLVGDLGEDEVEDSVKTLVKAVQRQAFAAEIKMLHQHGFVSKGSKLSDLMPFLDNEQILRVGGRLAKSRLAFGERHPMIIPAKHHLTTLIIKHEHFNNLHAGAQTVLMAIRSRFWPLNGRQAVKAVLRQCVICFRVKPRPLIQCMGQLPEDRVVPARPFLNCGVDYGGPYLVKESKFRNKKLLKAYMCIFVCFATKATHIELVSDLTSDGFLHALKRFTARRGLCRRIYSDNGTNFVGANHYLRQVLEVAKSPSIRRYLSQNRIEWRFIPPRSPHFGGLWESAIRSAKYHLKRILGNAPLTSEELYTCLVQVEAVLNSRPLCPLSEDPESLEVLTPGHFLVGTRLKAVPEAPVEQQPSRYATRYRHLQALMQQFWSKWQHNYLNTLQQCSKWRYSNVPEKLKDAVVVIHEDHTPPLSWKLGRVVEVHPGADGRTRVVTLRTRDGVLKRAVTKISLLPVNE